MLIVIEGPDRVGKSTMASTLRTRMVAGLNRRVVTIHRGAPKDTDHPLRDYALPISTYSPTTPTDRMTHSMVTDRWHLGDLVYGPIYRGECRQTLQMIAYTEALITARGGIRLHMTADPAIIMKRIENEGEDNSYLKLADVSHVVASFRQVCDGADGAWIRTDTTGWTDESYTVRAADKLIDTALKTEAMALPIHLSDSDYVGPLRPRFLVVGNDTETRRSGHGDRTSYAAFTPWEGSIAEYLIGCMLESGMNMFSDTGLTKTNGYSLGALHKALGQPSIIALGDDGLDYVNQNGLTAAGWLRDPEREHKFRKKNRDRYVKGFREQMQYILTAPKPIKI